MDKPNRVAEMNEFVDDPDDEIDDARIREANRVAAPLFVMQLLQEDLEEQGVIDRGRGDRLRWGEDDDEILICRGQKNL